MGLVRSPNDIVFAAALVLLAAIPYSAVSNLRIGTILRMGPGYLPTILCGLIALTAGCLFVRALFVVGDRLHTWPLRPLTFVLGGLFAFGLLLERAGLVLSMPTLVVLVSLADREARFIDIAALAIGLTLFSAVVFVLALGLPIPLWPVG